MTQPDKKYIVVEGCIGVGKSSLVSLLAPKLQARKIMEVVEDNPFIGKFYHDPKRYAFQTQMFFLLSRYRQQMELVQQGLFQQRVVSDHLFARDRIFANLTLDDQELALYDQLYPILESRVLRPDAVVFLQATTDVLWHRIQLQGRDFEKQITKVYLEDLNEAYNYFFFHYSETPLLVINTSAIDFVRSEADLDDLVRQIMVMKPGVQYYTPVS